MEPFACAAGTVPWIRMSTVAPLASAPMVQVRGVPVVVQFSQVPETLYCTVAAAVKVW